MLKVGDKAFDFTLNITKDEKFTLSEFLGKKVVIYFYPKDDTPGCTKEACSFRDVYDELLELGAVVVGISPDGVNKHDRFKEKYNLPFYLVADEEHTVAEAYGAWGEKKMYGKSYMGIIRSTFIVDEKGYVIKVYPKVSPPTHGEEIVEYLKNS